MKVKSKADAQLRADQIGSFQIELEKIEQENIIALSDSQHSAIAIYHENLLAKLSSTFDIDSNKREKQLSLGMKIASFLGAIGLAASLFFLFYQYFLESWRQNIDPGSGLVAFFLEPIRQFNKCLIG